MLTSACKEDIQRVTEYRRILVLCKEWQFGGQDVIRTTRIPRPRHKRFYATFRSRLLENFNGDCNTCDGGRFCTGCFELATDAKIGGWRRVTPDGIGTGQRSSVPSSQDDPDRVSARPLLLKGSVIVSHPFLGVFCRVRPRPGGAVTHIA